MLMMRMMTIRHRPSMVWHNLCWDQGPNSTTTSKHIVTITTPIATNTVYLGLHYKCDIPFIELFFRCYLTPSSISFIKTDLRSRVFLPWLSRLFIINQRLCYLYFIQDEKVGFKRDLTKRPNNNMEIILMDRHYNCCRLTLGQPYSVFQEYII